MRPTRACPRNGCAYGFTGHGFEGSAKPHQNAVEAAWNKLVSERDAVEKDYKKLLKQKALPTKIAKGLPKDLQGKG